MPGSYSWMPCAAQGVKGFGDDDDDDDDEEQVIGTCSAHWRNYKLIPKEGWGAYKRMTGDVL